MVKKESFIAFLSLLRKSNFDFMVVGSLALQVCGLDVDPHDLDVEVICPKEKEIIFETLSIVSKNNFYETKETYPGAKWEHKPYIFEFQGLLVNVWCVQEFTHKSFIYKDYVKYAGVMTVLKEKMKLGRIKDKTFMLDLIGKLTKI